MATQTYKTPGVYIQEPNSFPPSIVGVETAVPCFIGFTERADDSDARSLTLIPKRIESMAEFVQHFGQGYPELYYLVAGEVEAAGRGGTDSADQLWGHITLDGQTTYTLVEKGSASYKLYNSMRLFYANGGGSCYVISCGLYDGDGVKEEPIAKALDVCETFIGPTMVVIPDAVLLEEDAYKDTVRKMLSTCQQAGDRMAIIDVRGAGTNTLPTQDNWKTVVQNFQDHMHGANSEEWRFGAAYFPPLVTSVVSPDEIDISNFATDSTQLDALKLALRRAIEASYPPIPGETPATAPGGQGGGDSGGEHVAAGLPTLNNKGNLIYATYVAKIGAAAPAQTPALSTAEAERQTKLRNKQLTQSLVAMVPGFKQLLAAVAATQGVLPPSGAIAGVWTANDALRGVWNAPANTGIATLVRPLIQIDNKSQEDMNVPVNSMAVNAIRTFQGRGTLIWGARTLDSNSNDWRYIQVRRTMIYVEQSVKQALEAMVFRPNTAQTWVTVVAMIESFLHGLWASGGLMGGSAEEAYNVQAGLGSTMTPQDVLEGVMRVHITLQMVHPAEFIELTFKQQMLGGA